MPIAIMMNGIAGLTATGLFNRHTVMLYQRNDYSGGYSNTRLVAAESHSNESWVRFYSLSA